jgi:hypothetical protein
MEKSGTWNPYPSANMENLSSIVWPELNLFDRQEKSNENILKKLFANIDFH